MWVMKATSENDNADRFLIIAVIAWIVRGQQTAGSDTKALGIGGREGSGAMHGAQGQGMMAVDDGRIGRR